MLIKLLLPVASIVLGASMLENGKPPISTQDPVTARLAALRGGDMACGVAQMWDCTTDTNGQVCNFQNSICGPLTPNCPTNIHCAGSACSNATLFHLCNIAGPVCNDQSSIDCGKADPGFCKVVTWSAPDSSCPSAVRNYCGTTAGHACNHQAGEQVPCPSFTKCQ